MKLFRYQREDGKVPFSEWLNGLRDKRAQAQVRVRLQRLAAGNLGDIKAVGGGVSELRIHLGPGYRVYLAKAGFFCSAGATSPVSKKTLKRRETI